MVSRCLVGRFISAKAHLHSHLHIYIPLQKKKGFANPRLPKLNAPALKIDCPFFYSPGLVDLDVLPPL